MVWQRSAYTAVPAVFVLLWVFGKCLRAHFLRKRTILFDVPKLGVPRPDNKRLKGAAVICGGSIAGLWTARICLDHFEEVVIVEPEAWLSTEEGITNVFDEKGNRLEGRGLHPRTRILQYSAQHVFQPVALVAMRKLFPAFDDEIRRADGRIARAEYNVHMLGKTRRTPKMVYPDDYSQGFFVTRESYERILRRLVLSCSDRIRWVAGTVTGLTPNEKNPTVLQSVSVRTELGNEEILPATLVVDCTGGSQAGFKWLKRIFSDPKYAAALQRCNTVPKGALAFDGDLRIEYSTMTRHRRFRVYVPPEMRPRLPIPGGYDKETWLFTYFPRLGVEREVFMIERMEGHRIEWAFGGWGEPPVPETFADVKDWLKNLGPDAAIPGWIFDLADILLEIKDEHDMDAGRHPNCSWIRYERAPYVPSNFIAIGDSYMRVNPVYGQGCSKAAIGAITLDSLLRRPSLRESTSIPPGFSREFIKHQLPRVAGTWMQTKPNDYLWDTTTPVKGEKLSDERFRGKMALLLMQLAGDDEYVNSTLWHIRTFLAPSTDLLHPYILAKLFLLYVRQQFGWA